MKTSRIKYSKFNSQYSQLVQMADNIGIINPKNINATNFKDMRAKQKVILQINTEKENGGENIFIETEELYEFLSGIQINKEADIAQQVYFALKNRKFVEYPSELENGVLVFEECSRNENMKIPFRFYVFRLFAPINKISTSLAVSICCTKTFNDGMDLNYIAFSDANSFQDILLHKEAINSLENGIVGIGNEIIKDNYALKMYEYFRVIINLIFYMNAYPENVIDGVPQKAIIDEKVFTNKNRITVLKNIELLKKQETSPHLRRGHFRTFTSDFYVNKKGETIWIEPMFIKGEAKTVTESS
jgi:hypothetical protein